MPIAAVEYRVAVHATRFNGDEVEEYLPLLAAKYDLPEDLVQLQWRLFGGAAPCLNLQPGEELLDGELASLSTDCSQLRRRASRPGRACSWKRSAR